MRIEKANIKIADSALIQRRPKNGRGSNCHSHDNCMLLLHVILLYIHITFYGKNNKHPARGGLSPGDAPSEGGALRGARHAHLTG